MRKCKAYHTMSTSKDVKDGPCFAVEGLEPTLQKLIFRKFGLRPKLFEGNLGLREGSFVHTNAYNVCHPDQLGKRVILSFVDMPGLLEIETFGELTIIHPECDSPYCHKRHANEKAPTPCPYTWVTYQFQDPNISPEFWKPVDVVYPSYECALGDMEEKWIDLNAFPE